MEEYTSYAMNNISFSGLYTQYYKRSFLFVKSYVRDDMVAEDIASEALIQLWETLKTETVNTPLALLTTILKNKALNYLKHQAIEWEAMEDISDKQIRDTSYRIATLQACNPEEMFSSEITRILEDTLASLPEQTTFISESQAAPSIISPIMECPETSCSSFSTHTCASKESAVLTNAAAARACSPFSFVIFSILETPDVVIRCPFPQV